jgi:hypothetical protein
MASATRLGRLAEACGAAVSVVVGGEPPEPPSPGGDPGAVLERLVARQPAYRWDRLRGHYVVFPADDVWRRRVTVAIAGPRADAAERLLAELGHALPELGDLAGVVVKGDPASPVFAAPARVDGEDSVVGHLAALLGDDGALALALEPGPAGARVLHFQRVGGPA